MYLESPSQRISATVIERVPGCPHAAAAAEQRALLVSAPVAVELSASPLNGDLDGGDEDDEDEEDFDEDDELCTPPSRELDLS